MVVAAVDCTFYASFLSCFSFSSRDPCFHHSHRVIVGSRDSFSKRLVELHWKIFFQHRHSLVICVWRKDGKRFVAVSWRNERRYSHATLGYTKNQVSSSFETNSTTIMMMLLDLQRDSPENFLTNSVIFQNVASILQRKIVWFITLRWTQDDLFSSFVIINFQSANYD